jgi:hypothetical protein
MPETDKTFWCAWIADTNVLTVWDLVTRKMDEASWTLVTMLDSNENVVELTAVKQLLTEQVCRASPVGGGVLLDGECFAALRVHGDNFFTGYDEIWMTGENDLRPKPPNIRLSSESAISELPVSGLGHWMQGEGLSLGLGDGYGVNVATFEPWVVQLLIDAYGDSLHVADADASW